jgi:hypothetical protein
LFKKKFLVSVFPNPGSGSFTVNIIVSDQPKEDFNIEIVNFLGVSLLNMVTDKSTFSLDISSFPKGIYFIKVIAGMDSQTQKIILQY